MSLLSKIGRKWGRENPAVALHRTQQLPSGEGRAAFISAVVAGLSEQSPAEAARFAAKLPVGAAQGSAVQAIASRWAEINPAEAAQWVSGSLPVAGTDMHSHCGRAMGPHAAARWLSAMPANAACDSAITAFVQQASTYSPELAATMTQRISDRDLRNAMIENVARQWLGLDRAAAESWLVLSGLPDEMRSGGRLTRTSAATSGRARE